MSELEKALQDGLDRLAEEGLTRTLEPGSGIDFTSNDYLGMSLSPAFGDRVGELSGPAWNIVELPDTLGLEGYFGVLAREFDTPQASVCPQHQIAIPSHLSPVHLLELFHQLGPN